MKLLFRLLKSSFTDQLAYISAVVGALCWLVHFRYPALLPGSLRETAHIYMTVIASLAAGLLIAKYILMEGYVRSMQEVHAEKEAFAVIIQRMEGVLQDSKEERERILERESLLKKKLKSLENSMTEAQLSSMRKKIRIDEEDRKTSLTFLVQALRSRLQELDNAKDPDIARAAAVLKKEAQMLENEIKKGEMSFYELVLSINEIREHIHDLTSLRSQSGGEEEGRTDRRNACDFHWFDAQTDPSSVDRIYKFLKVAFHPDRFSSERLKEEAKIHFQEAVQAYSTLKERLRTTH